MVRYSHLSFWECLERKRRGGGREGGREGGEKGGGKGEGKGVRREGEWGGGGLGTSRSDGVSSRFGRPCFPINC